jgi:hypothetical protein
MTRGKPRDGSKNPGGRPKEWTAEALESLADNLLQWATQDDAMFLASFCKMHGIYRQRLTEFAKENSKFSDALKVAQNTCEANIATATADGAIPPAFGIFGLKQHAWTDKQEVKHSGGVTIQSTPTDEDL